MMRFRATVAWDFECDSQDEAHELIRNRLGEDFQFTLRLDKLKNKIDKVKLGEFKMEEFIPFITNEDIKREYECDGVKYFVKMNSHRYFIFRECINCMVCGLLGTRLYLEYHSADKSPHFNVYGEEDDKLIMMTKDHIHAKAFGGEDRHSNYQTMCLICNNLKGHSNLTLEAVKELRAVYNENKKKVTRKKLNFLIEEARSRLEQPWPNAKVSGTQRKKQLAKIKATADAIVTVCDINLYSEKDLEMYGKSVYDSVEKGHKHIGCIKKGTCLEPLVATKEKIMCKLFDHDVVVLHHSLVKAKE